MNAHLLALSAYRPGRVITNAEAGAQAGVTDQWVAQRTGISTRRHTEKSVLDLATTAATNAVAAAGIRAAEVDQLIMVTESHPVQSPPHAPSIADNIGAVAAGAFDLVAACAGFSYALGVAADLVNGGSAGTILVVSAERMSAWLDWQDSGTAAIFGDGAGAAIVTASTERTIWPYAKRSDGSMRDLIRMEPASWHLAMEATPPVWPVVRMHGPRVYRWVIENGPQIIDDALAKAGVTRDDIDVFVPHQANRRITSELVKRANLGHAVIADDIVHMGNTSSASIPLAATALLASGQAAPGQKALFFGFGAGMTAAAQVVLLPSAFSDHAETSPEVGGFAEQSGSLARVA
ncbi:beta-ketoacyl-ACP synthase 3 [Pseudarthrobacter phenanthrenivorans]|uniref:beta-ketoacyl-ACP synthase 3 n=1 Tax=Pseudarthrobacter phenanthrenivorans TaxID=361575 RepID=UPI00068E27A2|nr:beta-ketoacyl-ACP synthase 3 [Pseudarthrobacter phenanthrenivorans]